MTKQAESQDSSDALFADFAIEDRIELKWALLFGKAKHEESPRVYSTMQAWRLALLRPSIDTFEKLSKDPTASFNRAISFMSIAGVLGPFLILFAQFAYTLLFQGIDELFVVQDPATGANVLPAGIAVLIPYLLCLLPIALVAFLVFCVIVILCIQSTARALGGNSPLDRTAYAFAVSAAPITILSTAALVIPAIGILIAALLWLYELLVLAMAMRAVQYLAWGESVVVAISPLLVGFACWCSCFGFLLASGNSLF